MSFVFPFSESSLPSLALPVLLCWLLLSWWSFAPSGCSSLCVWHLFLIGLVFNFWPWSQVLHTLRSMTLVMQAKPSELGLS